MRRLNMLSKNLFTCSIISFLSIMFLILVFYTLLFPSADVNIAEASREAEQTELKFYLKSDSSISSDISLSSFNIASVSLDSLSMMRLAKFEDVQEDYPLNKDRALLKEEGTSQMKEEVTELFPLPEEEVSTKKLASNGEEYKYYEVYDFLYGSKEWHSLDLELQEYTYELCIEYGIEEYFPLILSQLFIESTYNPKAVSSTNDYGIAQINKCNHKWLKEVLGIQDFLDPKESILCNIYMMSDYLHKVGPEKSLLWYNSGNPNTKIKSSLKYRDNIINLWKNYTRVLDES